MIGLEGDNLKVEACELKKQKVVLRAELDPAAKLFQRISDTDQNGRN